MVVEYLEILNKDSKDTGKNGVGKGRYMFVDPKKRSILGGHRQ